MSYRGTDAYYLQQATALQAMYDQNVSNPDMFTTGMFTQLGTFQAGEDVLSLLSDPNTTPEQLADAIKLAGIAMHDMEIERLYLASQYMDECTESAKAMARGEEEAFLHMQKLGSEIDNLRQAKGILSKLERTGKLTDAEVDVIAGQTRSEKYNSKDKIKKVIKKGRQSTEFKEMVATLGTDFKFQEGAIRADLESAANETIKSILKSGIDVGQQQTFVDALIDLQEGRIDVQGLENVLDNLGIAEDLKAQML